MPSKKLISTLHVRDLELKVNLGWRNKELKQKQKILLNLEIKFPSQPKACQTDNLEDTICYAQLIQKIRDVISEKNYRLVEHLAAEIYAIAKINLPKKFKLQVSITKYPRKYIEGLTGGVCFKYGDEN